MWSKILSHSDLRGGRNAMLVCKDWKQELENHRAFWDSQSERLLKRKLEPSKDSQSAKKRLKTEVISLKEMGEFSSEACANAHMAPQKKLPLV